MGAEESTATDGKRPTATDGKQRRRAVPRSRHGEWEPPAGRDPLATLAAQTEETLDAPRPYYGGRTHSAAEVFGIIAEHDLYHAGQINFVRCLIAGAKQAWTIPPPGGWSPARRSGL